MALLVAMVFIYGSRPLSATTVEGIGTSTSILVKSKIGELIHPDVEQVLFVQESSAKRPLLRIVQIRTPSSRGLKQLRGMHIDIVRIKADPGRAKGEELFSSGYIVEAVVTKGELAKLREMGFEVFEMSERK